MIGDSTTSAREGSKFHRNFGDTHPEAVCDYLS